MSIRTAKPMAEIRSSPIHGRGVYAFRRLPQCTYISTCDGRRYTAKILLEVDWDTHHDGMTYLFKLSDDTTIDGAEGVNDLRFHNRACRPNCEAEEVLNDDGTLELRLVILRAVTAGVKLLLDYRLTIDEQASPADFPCHCGLPACRTAMAAVAAVANDEV